MNNERRKVLEGLAERLSNVREDIEAIKSDLEQPRGEEEDYHANMPEGFQNGEKGDKAQAAIDAMSEAESELEEMLNTLDRAVEKLEEAQE